MNGRGSRVLVALLKHMGAARGLPVRALAEACEMPEREVRRYVSALREEGIPICAHPRTGYYIAENDAEIEEACRFLRARALHSLRLESRLRKIPLPDLLGQLRLPT